MVRLKLTCLLAVGMMFSCGGIVPAGKAGKMRTPGQGGDGEQLPAPEGPGGEDRQQQEEKVPAGEGLSLNSKIRMKNSDQLARDLAAGLNLDKDNLCRELGELACIEEVHKISLGGVDPYDKNIYRGRHDVGLSTPMVIERIVLSACEKRVADDLAGGEVIFSGTREQVAKNLIERAFLRDPQAGEVGKIATAFADETEANWALASCFAVFSSAEFLFY